MFGEKDKENIRGVECPVWQTPKYEASRKKAIEMIDKGNYGLVEGDFWILMNTYASGKKVMYTGLILSHNGCLKINDKLDDPFKAEFVKRDVAFDGNDKASVLYEYNDGTLYEVGEASASNCKNDYPYAMAFKRCFDRVVLKKSKLAYSGIYSEVEADEFKERVDDDAETQPRYIDKDQFARLKAMYSQDEIKAMFTELGIKKGTDMPVDYFLKKEQAYKDSTKELLKEPDSGIWG